MMTNREIRFRETLLQRRRRTEDQVTHKVHIHRSRPGHAAASESTIMEDWGRLAGNITKAGVPRMAAITNVKHAPYPVSPFPVNACIPTIGRGTVTKIVDALLTSTATNLNIFVIVQDNGQMVERLRTQYGNRKNVFIESIATKVGWAAAQNLVAQQPGALFMLGDDSVVTRDTVRMLEIAMATAFPDGDGIVVPLETQTLWGVGPMPGFGFVGSFPFVGDNFLNRFPERQILCPDYFAHSSDVELLDYGLSVNRYIQCAEATLDHFVFRPEDHDQTAMIIKSLAIRAIEIYVERNRKGYLWGKNFHRLDEPKR
jgi:hypothetical protein